MWPHDSTPASIPELFWRQVRRHPARPAVAAAAGAVSYAALASRVAAYADLVTGAGDRADQRIGLLLDHGVDMIAGMLATLSAGGTYVPLDPRYPAARLRAMAAQASVSCVLTSAQHLDTAADLGTVSAGAARPAVLNVSDITLSPADAGGEPSWSRWSARTVDPSTPAYILHTSGSTGTPKGVAQTHRNVLHQVRLHTRNLGITARDRISVVTSFGFDMAVTDTFSALLNGATSVPVDVRELGLVGLAAALREHEVSVYHSTPTVFRYLADYLASQRAGGMTGTGPTLPRLRVVVLGGEPVTTGDLRRCRDHLPADGMLVNGYGATEISFAVQHHIRLAGAGDATPDERDGHDGPNEASDGVLPIGRPLDGIEVDLIGQDGTAADHGEIVISSRYLAEYWAQPDEAATRFQTGQDGVRRYRTGDLAMRRPDGLLVYLGRADRQVKIRGYRVEPTEVELAIEALPGVRHAAVVADRQPGAVAAEPVLRAFVCPAAGAAPRASSVRSALAATLPEYLVPATVTVVDDLPLTPTGKIDATALLRLHPLVPVGDRPAGTPDGAGQVAEVIAATWATALGRDHIGQYDRFFDVGGHSLLAATVHHQLVTRLGRSFPLTAIYANPTVAALADYLDGTGAPAARPAARSERDLVADRIARRRRHRTGRSAR